MSVYVHIPFCRTVCDFCPYCKTAYDKSRLERYVSALLAELVGVPGDGVGETPVGSVYFGGGTPTSFANHDIGLILDCIRDRIGLCEGAGVTCEAHPATLAGGARIAAMAGIGINRISVGCQTFDAEVLERCDRNVHTPEQIKTIIAAAAEAGVATNVDMMLGLPGQTVAGVERDLAILEDIRPVAVEYIRHEIVNRLVIALYEREPELVVKDDDLFEMVYLAQDWMTKHGYEQNGRFTNDQQWEYRYHWLKEMPILAFGVRARSYTKTVCYDKHEDLGMYLRSTEKGIPPIIRYVELTEREQMYRSLLLNLQIKSGLDVGAFESRFGQDPCTAFAPLIEALVRYGCVVVDETSVRLTDMGAYFVEDVCDLITDSAVKEQSADLVRAPHSEGSTSARWSRPSAT